MDELQTRSTSGSTVYALIRNSLALLWDASSFVTYADADVTAAAIPLTEQVNSGFFVGNFPTAITTPDTYSIEFFQQVGSAPAYTDTFIAGGSITWNGVSSPSLATTTDLISAAYLTTYLNNSSVPAPLITQLIPVATDAIQKYCNRIFTVQSYIEYYDGPGDISLLLKQRPVVSLSQVIMQPYSANPVTITGTDFIVDTIHGIIRFKPTSTYQYAGYFPYGGIGEGNVQVTYSAGYATIPNDLAQACAQVCQNLILWTGQDTSLKAYRIGGMAGLQLGFGPDSGKIITDPIAKVLDLYRRRIV